MRHSRCVFSVTNKSRRGPGSSVGIATELRAGRSRIESRWGRDFLPLQTSPGAQPASCAMGTGSFLEVKCGQGVLLTTHSLLVFSHGRVELYLYPPSGPHRACNGIIYLYLFSVKIYIFSLTRYNVNNLRGT